MFIWEKGTFFCPVVAIMVSIFFDTGPRISSVARLKPSARWSISHLQIDFSIFRFQVAAVFVKKKKYPPTPLPVGAPFASNSRSALSAWAG